MNLNHKNISSGLSLGIPNIADKLEKGGMEKGANQFGAISTDWKKLFSAPTDQLLNFFPPCRSEGKVIVSPPDEVCEEGELIWKNAFVEQFMGKIPNFSVFQKMINIIWGEEGEVDIKPTGYNLFIIQFSNSIMRDRVLETSPWHIQNKPLIVRKWKPMMKSLELNMRKLPILVHLGSIPLELFS